MSPFFDRSPKSAHMLEWKVWVFSVGAVMALTGIYFEWTWLTGAAIVVLVAGAFLRFGCGNVSEPARAPGPTDEEGDLDG